MQIVLIVLVVLVAWVAQAVLLAKRRARKLSLVGDEVLSVLEKARKPLNFTEILDAIAVSRGAKVRTGYTRVSSAIKVLHTEGCISSTQNPSRYEMLSDTARYSVTAQGRQLLRSKRRSSGT